MKKGTLLLTLGLFIATLGIMGCGDDSAALEQARLDSIRVADSLANIALMDSLRQDSIDMAETAYLDSIANAAANATVPSGNKTTTKTTTKDPNTTNTTTNTNVKTNDGGKVRGVQLEPKSTSTRLNGGNNNGGTRLQGGTTGGKTTGGTRLQGGGN